MTATIGSLFSGVGGLELGLERAGLGPVIWQVERDAYCRGILAHHWPAARRYDDVREVGSELAPVDIICGGFPCQDISTAGKGGGLAGPRSGLWYEYLRIVRLVRPRVVVVENVSALLVRGLGVVLGGLAESGYDATWDCIPAAAVGAPHRRDRLFVVAWLADTDGIDRQGKLGEGAGCRQPELPSGDRGGDAKLADAHGAGRPGPEHERAGGRRRPADAGSGVLADSDGARREASRWQRALRGEHGEEGEPVPRPGGDWPPGPDDVHAWGRVQADAQPAFCRLADGLPAGLARDRTAKLRALGNAVVPAVGEVVGRVVRQVLGAGQ